MASFNSSATTKKGLDLIAKGCGVEFTHIELGGGMMPEGKPVNEMEKLVDKVIQLPLVKSKFLGNGKYVVGAYFDNSMITKSFYYREIGVFAKDPDLGTILFSYANSGQMAERIEPATASNFISKSIDPIIAVSGTDKVTFNIDPAGVVTREVFKDHREQKELDHPDDSVLQKHLAPFKINQIGEEKRLEEHLAGFNDKMESIQKTVSFVVGRSFDDGSVQPGCNFHWPAMSFTMIMSAIGHSAREQFLTNYKIVFRPGAYIGSNNSEEISMPNAYDGSTVEVCAETPNSVTFVDLPFKTYDTCDYIFRNINITRSNSLKESAIAMGEDSQMPARIRLYNCHITEYPYIFGSDLNYSYLESGGVVLQCHDCVFEPVKSILFFDDYNGVVVDHFSMHRCTVNYSYKNSNNSGYLLQNKSQYTSTYGTQNADNLGVSPGIFLYNCFFNAQEYGRINLYSLGSQEKRGSDNCVIKGCRFVNTTLNLTAYNNVSFIENHFIQNDRFLEGPSLSGLSIDAYQCQVLGNYFEVTPTGQEGRFCLSAYSNVSESEIRIIGNTFRKNSPSTRPSFSIGAVTCSYDKGRAIITNNNFYEISYSIRVHGRHSSGEVSMCNIANNGIYNKVAHPYEAITIDGVGFINISGNTIRATQIYSASSVNGIDILSGVVKSVVINGNSVFITAISASMVHTIRVATASAAAGLVTSNHISKAVELGPSGMTNASNPVTTV